MKVTLEYIARAAGVSKATVSRVLNDKAEGVGPLTRQRVKAVIDKLEYQPNSPGGSASITKTHTIGLIIPDITNPFYSTIVKVIGDSLEASDYTLLLSNTNDSFDTEQKQLATFVTKRVDGIILTTSSNHIDEVKCMIFKYNVPLVLLDRTVENISYCPGVFIDNEYALFCSTEHLIQKGHYKIAYVTGQPEVSTTQRRLAGYLVAHKQYKIPFRSELLVHGEYTYESGYRKVLELLESGVDFSALLMGNDMMAIGALSALKKYKKKVPDEIELIGFDNIELSGIIEPRLTTVEQPVTELGQRAADMILKLINKEELPINAVRLEPKMIFRETTR